MLGELTSERLSALCAAAKQKQARKEINENLGANRTALYDAMRCEQPKLRKNAYRLCGALGVVADIPALCCALARENTLFVVPSLILALGALGQEAPDGNAAIETLQSYTPPGQQSPEQEKHIREIHEALTKARNLFDSAPLKSWDKLPVPRPVLCVAPEGFAEELKQELEELGFAPQMADGKLTVQTDDIAGLYRANGLAEALFPIAENVPLTPAAIADAAAQAGLTDGAYRISAIGYDKEKLPLIAAVARLLGGKNNPSHYDCELRVVVKSPFACDLYGKPWNVSDHRYPWRKHTIAASMHPALAACLCRWAQGFEQTDRPRVLDPFCGSGTLLFSREALGDCHCTIGVDKIPGTVEKARENADAGSSPAAFVVKDILRFSSREGFDLLLANLPFGNRVGTHSINEDLYCNFVRRLPDLLAPDGIAVLYTMEYRLLKRCLGAQPALRIAANKRTEAGGLLPQAVIVTRSSDERL